MRSDKSRIRLGLSKRKKLPSIKFLGCSYLPWKLPLVLRAAREWNIQQTGENEFSISRFGQVLQLPTDNLGVLLGEWNEWARDYVPQFSLKNKVVLDVGAGAGETALMFFLNGARKVISVESDPMSIKYLRVNAQANDWNMEIIHDKFKLPYLSLGADFLKMDCEGCENALLSAASLPPCRIEVHSRTLQKALGNQFGLRVLRYSFSQDLTSIMGT